MNHLVDQVRKNGARDPQLISSIPEASYILRVTNYMEINILLQKLAQPAQRAILGAGITTLEQLSEMTETEIYNLHGIGKNAMKTIQVTLQEHGLALKSPG